MDHDKQCVLVIIGADAMGNKDIVGMVDGYRESAQSWKELLLDLKRRGLETGPELAVGDGALGFWKALREVYGETRVQRCWVHKTANVLNQMPKSLQAKAKGHLHDIWMAETRADAEAAFDFFIAAYGAKYHKAAERLVKDRERLLSFYDFPAEHWKHIRTTNPIESTFATVRLRTVKTKGVPEPQDGARHGLQTDLECQAEMAEAGRIKSTRRTRRRSAVQGRNQDNQTRRLIAPSPTFGHSSDILDGDNTALGVWADSAYRSAEIEAALKKKGLRSRIHRKARRNKPLSEREKQGNKTRSSVRVRVEHVFGAQSNDMGGTLLRSVGLARAKARIGLKNLAYNMRRLVQLNRLAAAV